MKKIVRKEMILVLSLVFILSVVGCSKSSDEDKSDDVKEDKTEEIKDVEEGEEDEEEAIETTEAPTPTPEPLPTIDVGETVSNDTVEYTMTSVDFMDKVEPPTDSSWYTYYQASEGEDFIVIEFDVKNISTSAISCDAGFIDIFMLYDGMYEYDSDDGGFTLTLDSDNNFSYSTHSLAPLASEHMYFLFALPEEVTQSDASLEIYLTLYDGGEYLYVAR